MNKERRDGKKSSIPSPNPSHQEEEIPSQVPKTFDEKQSERWSFNRGDNNSYTSFLAFTYGNDLNYNISSNISTMYWSAGSPTY